MNLEEAVTRWVRANYMFWHGPYAHGNEATAELVAAEDGLRIALTGTDDPREAAEAIGVDFEKLERLYRQRRASGAKVGVIGSSEDYPDPPPEPRYARLPEDDAPARTKKKKKKKKKSTKTKKVRLVKR